MSDPLNQSELEILQNQKQIEEEKKQQLNLRFLKNLNFNTTNDNQNIENNQNNKENTKSVQQ